MTKFRGQTASKEKRTICICGIDDSELAALPHIIKLDRRRFCQVCGRSKRKIRLSSKWLVKYEHQVAGWIVYRGSRMLRDYFPTQEDAAEAAKEKNKLKP